MTDPAWDLKGYALAFAAKQRLFQYRTRISPQLLEEIRRLARERGETFYGEYVVLDSHIEQAVERIYGNTCTATTS
jgi:hypothetical protein